MSDRTDTTPPTPSHGGTPAGPRQGPTMVPRHVAMHNPRTPPASPQASAAFSPSAATKSPGATSSAMPPPPLYVLGGAAAARPPRNSFPGTPLAASQSATSMNVPPLESTTAVSDALRVQPFLGGVLPSEADVVAYEQLVASDSAFLRWIRQMEEMRNARPGTSADAAKTPNRQHVMLLGAARAIRGTIIHFTGPMEPGMAGEDLPIEHIEDGVLVVNSKGLIMACGPWEELRSRIPAATKLDDYTGNFIVPGMVDCHVHYPQVGMIASDGEQLLDWLQKYTFPTEMKFADAQHAQTVAHFFLEELLRQGTTTALVFATVHPQSVDAFFSEAQKRRMRMICGKVLMDRNAPDELLDTPAQGYAESKMLIERWHKQDRLLYAVTPRFAPTSTDEQLKLAGQLLTEYPDLYMHTHLSENKNEISWVQELFPESKGYLDVYERAGLVGPRSVFAHCVHSTEAEVAHMKHKDSTIAWCAMSNMFLGSGLFNRTVAHDMGVRMGLGSDMGAGNSISVLCAMEASYKNEQLRHTNVDPISLFYYGTYGGAHALHLQDKIGNFDVGKEADFVVLDPRANPLIEMRMLGATLLKEKLFLLAMLKSDRVVRATYVLGHVAYRRGD